MCMHMTRGGTPLVNAHAQRCRRTINKVEQSATKQRTSKQYGGKIRLWRSTGANGNRSTKSMVQRRISIVYWKPERRPVSNLFWQKEYQDGTGKEGGRRGTGAEKEGCFAHVVPVWHIEHVRSAKHHRHQKGVLDIRYVSSWSAIDG